MTDASPASPDQGSTVAATPARPQLTPHVAMKKVIILVNPLSGGVGAQAAAEAEAVLGLYDLEATVVTLEGAKIPTQIAEALEAKPDVLFVLAGDGTARSVASKAKPDGPMIAPLPGGTMNMLPKALYGTADWKLALKRALEEGEPQAVSGGEVQGEYFYCAAILGSPALWAPAREAMRTGKLGLAWTYGRRALQEPVGLEAAAMNLSDVSEAFRLAANAVFSDWRQDPSVQTQPARLIRVRGRSRIPAVLDGEPVLLPNDITVAFVAKAFQALVPDPPAAEDSV